MPSRAQRSLSYGLSGVDEERLEVVDAPIRERKILLVQIAMQAMLTAGSLFA